MGSAASWEREPGECIRLEAGPESLAALKNAINRT